MFNFTAQTTTDYNSSLNEEEFHSNYNTFHDFGEPNPLHNSSGTSVPLLPLAHDKKKLLTKKYCEKIITFWLRCNLLDHTNSHMDTLELFRHFSCIYICSISFCLKYERLLDQRWGSETTKSSIIKLLNTQQSFIIHQDKFRKGRSKKVINFQELSKSHSISMECRVPNIYECNLCAYEFEIYQKYIDYKRFNMDTHDRRHFPIDGTHKIGICTKHKDKSYFVGLLSYFNYNECKSRYNKHKQEGVLYKMDGLNGKSKTPIGGEIALRKHEILEMKVNWIEKKLVFNRISVFSQRGRSVRSKREIVIDLKANKTKSKDLMHLDVLDLEWYPMCEVCVNEVDSFMWNTEKDKDFITYTINSVSLL